MNFQKVKYTLENLDDSTLLEVINDPINWDNSQRTLKRSLKNYGVTTELSKGLEFTKDSANFLRKAYDLKGSEANVVLKEYLVNPTTDHYYLNTNGTLNFETYTDEADRVKVAFETGGLTALIKSKQNEELELGSNTDINGNDISELEYIDVALTSRDILLVSELEQSEVQALTFITSPPPNNGSYDTGLKTLRFTPKSKVISNSDQENINDVVYVSESDSYAFNHPGYGDGNGYNLSTSKHFYNSSDVSKVIKINIDLDITSYNLIAPINPPFSGKIQQITVEVIKSKFTNGVHNLTGSKLLGGVVFNQTDLEKRTAIELNTDLQVLVGESLHLSITTLSSPHGTNGAINVIPQYRYKLDVHKFDVTITEDSTREDTRTKALFIHETSERMMELITGEKERFRSDFYGRTDIGYNTDGEFSKTALTTGFFVRNFNNSAFNLKLKDLLNDSNVIHNTGWFIDNVGGKEVLSIEDVSFFFRPEVAIEITEKVSNVKRTVAKDFHYTGMTFGYEKGGEYEEAMGLDEYNILSNYTTPLTKTEKKNQKKSKSRADSYGREFARRKQKLNFPQEDTRYDKDKILLDLKAGDGLAFEERVWQDDYEVAPTGVFSPETATNLRLTPYRISQRHEKIYGSSLTKQQGAKITYSSTDGNSDLSTKKVNESVKKESDNIEVSEIDRPLFVAEYIEFEFPLNFELKQQVFGKTNVNNRMITNVYFKVKFINENNKTEYGYIVQIEPNKEGKWKLLKAY